MSYDYSIRKPSQCCALNYGCQRPEFCDAFGYSCGDAEAPRITPEMLEKIELKINPRHG